MYVKFFRVRVIFRTQVFAGFVVLHFVFKVTISKMLNFCSRFLFHSTLLINRLLASAFVLVNGIVFDR